MSVPKTKRNQLIYEAWLNGLLMGEIARGYKISIERVRSIIYARKYRMKLLLKQKYRVDHKIAELLKSETVNR